MALSGKVTDRRSQKKSLRDRTIHETGANRETQELNRIEITGALVKGPMTTKRQSERDWPEAPSAPRLRPFSDRARKVVTSPKYVLGAKRKCPVEEDDKRRGAQHRRPRDIKKAALGRLFLCFDGFHGSKGVRAQWAIA